MFFFFACTYLWVCALFLAPLLSVLHFFSFSSCMKNTLQTGRCFGTIAPLLRVGLVCRFWYHRSRPILHLSSSVLGSFPVASWPGLKQNQGTWERCRSRCIFSLFVFDRPVSSLMGLPTYPSASTLNYILSTTLPAFSPSPLSAPLSPPTPPPFLEHACMLLRPPSVVCWEVRKCRPRLSGRCFCSSLSFGKLSLSWKPAAFTCSFFG